MITGINNLITFIEINKLRYFSIKNSRGLIFKTEEKLLCEGSLDQLLAILKICKGDRFIIEGRQSLNTREIYVEEFKNN